MRFTTLGVLAGAIAMSATTPVFAAPETAEQAAHAFGKREDVLSASIAPDGKRIALIQARSPRGAALTIISLDGGAPKTILASEGTLDRLAGCDWSTAVRLVCTVELRADDSSRAIGYSRVIALNADGGGVTQLSSRTSSSALAIAQNGGEIIDWLPDADDGSVLMTRAVVPEYSTGTMLAQRREGLAVERVNTTTLKRSIVEPPRGGAVEYITDGRGVVRIVGVRSRTESGYDKNRIVYSYRKPDSRDWLPLATLTIGAGLSEGFNPQAVDAAQNVVYGFDEQDSRRALFRIALDGSLKRDLVYANPQVDVDGLIRIGRQHRVVGASFVTDRRQSVFFDPDLQKLGASLARTLRGTPLVTFVDATADESKLVLFAGSDTDPGKYYLFDKTARKLGEIAPVRSLLAVTPLAEVQAVRFPASDGTSIPGYLTLPPGSSGKGLPAIVMPHGGPGARDEWGFDWLAQYFANRGYAVLQPNFRGSTGYGNAWFQKNGFQSWRIAVGDVNAGGQWLVSQGIAAPSKLAIVGWSYGGYAALQSAVLDPTLFKAIIAIAPVTDLETLRGEARDYASYPMVDAFIGRGPHVRAGSPAQNAAAITAPVLMFHGDRDQNVGVGESRLMADRLREAGKSVEYIEYRQLDHQLADDTVRAQMLAKSDAFLRKTLGL
ncbi:S9 family peptidase [Sphingomonas sp. Leaf17]|uniref:S9 family peptidase n=1 Tax=Sphingomonas sp. Leaf17 TaxID=1735683 RepID=UPI0009E8139E|nr:S9 family peptidase [Sphingomonas sp. Leaf17]